MIGASRVSSTDLLIVLLSILMVDMFDWDVLGMS